MLVFTMKVNDEVIIGDNTIVKLVEIMSYKRIRLGFEAPKDIPIDRKRVRLSKLSGAR